MLKVVKKKEKFVSFGGPAYQLFRLRNLVERAVDLQPKAPADAYHLIGSRRGASDSKHAIALFQKPSRNRMKYFVKGLVADLLRPGQFNQRERKPLAKNRNVPGAENGQRVRLHLPDVSLDQGRIVIRARAIGTGNQNHHWFHGQRATAPCTRECSP